MNGADLADGVVFEDNNFNFEYKNDRLTEITKDNTMVSGKTATKLKNVNSYQSIPIVLENDTNKWWSYYDQ